MYQVNSSDLPGSDTSRKYEGGEHGLSSVSFFLVHNDPGEGPRPHRHAYDETFVILDGRVRVHVGTSRSKAATAISSSASRHPARLHSLGPGKARLICIHAAPQMHTESVDSTQR